MLLRQSLVDSTAPRPPVSGFTTAEASAPLPVSRTAMRRSGLVDWESPSETRAEHYKMVCEQLLAGRKSSGAGLPQGMIVVTSAGPREGKTACALNLAAAMAFSGSEFVILVDADVEGRTLSRELGLLELPGLSDVAGASSAGPGCVVYPTEIAGLVVCPAGRRMDRGRPASFAAPTGIECLRATYLDSVLVIDTPACLTSSTAQSLATRASHVVLVVEAQTTPSSDLEAALDRVGECKDVGLVLNKVRHGLR